MHERRDSGGSVEVHEVPLKLPARALLDRKMSVDKIAWHLVKIAGDRDMPGYCQ